ncbi:MAG: LamG-like jellyroll fold domain-containing protein [Bacteroidota bacterium]
MKKILLSTFLLSTSILSAQLDSTSFSVYPASTPLQAQYITVPITSSLQFTSEFTLECWVYVPNSSSQEIHLIETYFGNNGGYVLRLTQANTVKAFAMGASQPVTSGTSVVTTGEWNHVAATYSTATGNLKVYLNGVLDGTTTPGSAIYTNTTTLKIGARGDDSDVNDDILMDEVRIWNVALTESEIASNMSNCLTGNETGLVLYFDFENEGTIGAVTDRSSSNNNGTIVNNINPFENGVFECSSLAINENENSMKMTIYPNPASTVLAIESKMKIESVHIFDLNGTLVQTETSNEFSVAHLEGGMYIVNVTTNEGVASQRFVKH